MKPYGIYALEKMLPLLNYWERLHASHFNGDPQLPVLIEACREDYKAGGQSPGPWLALIDLLEEYGHKTHMREFLQSAYNLKAVGR